MILWWVTMKKVIVLVGVFLTLTINTMEEREKSLLSDKEKKSFMDCQKSFLSLGTLLESYKKPKKTHEFAQSFTTFSIELGKFIADPNSKKAEIAEKLLNFADSASNLFKYIKANEIFNKQDRASLQSIITTIETACTNLESLLPKDWKKKRDEKITAQLVAIMEHKVLFAFAPYMDTGSGEWGGGMKTNPSLP